MQKIISLTLLLFCQAVGYSQEREILVKESRIAYCNSKIEQVAIMDERLLVKDSKIVILNQRIENGEKTIQSLTDDSNTYIAQLAIRKVELNDTNQQNQALKVEVKQLKKEKGVLKIGFVGVVIIAIVGWIKG